MKKKNFSKEENKNKTIETKCHYCKSLPHLEANFFFKSFNLSQHLTNHNEHQKTKRKFPNLVHLPSFSLKTKQHFQTSNNQAFL